MPAQSFPAAERLPHAGRALEDRIRETRRSVESALSLGAPDLLTRHPIARYLAAYDAAPVLAPYHHVPAAAQATCEAIAARYGEEALEAYHRLAMAAAMARPAESGGLSIPPEIERLRGATLARILTDIHAPRRRFHRHDNDLFAKDFAVCRGKLLPGGVELIDRSAGVGRRVLIQGGPRQFLGGAHFFLSRMGGFKPVFETHFDRRLIGDFNADGYAALYVRLADLLIANPHVRGVTSSSWWHDPQLAAISPELAFINAIPESAGAMLFRGAENEDAIAGATRFAPHRAALYKQGLYRPCAYLLAWPRRAVIAWANCLRGV